ncbi:hypothetical protein NQZ68_031317 [Dissostichus eleginoides]|nr:hypothetical protein NQZ68_031317 [Dissostichus eleginoides]
METDQANKSVLSQKQDRHLADNQSIHRQSHKAALTHVPYSRKRNKTHLQKISTGDVVKRRDEEREEEEEEEERDSRSAKGLSVTGLKRRVCAFVSATHRRGPVSDICDGMQLAGRRKTPHEDC